MASIPKKPLSTYNVFVSEVFKELKGKGHSFSDSMKIISERWKTKKAAAADEAADDVADTEATEEAADEASDAAEEAADAEAAEEAVNAVERTTGDLLDYKPPFYIAQQCNCTSRKPMGLSSAIFKMYPEANDYVRNSHGSPGEIHVIGHVINMFAQVNPGPARRPNTNDAENNRLSYFAACLEEIQRQIPKGSTVVFPWQIGCGLAGGNWEKYQPMIESFAKSVNTILVQRM